MTKRPLRRIQYKIVVYNKMGIIRDIQPIRKAYMWKRKGLPKEMFEPFTKSWN